jgi:hypothetical protein
LPVGGVNLAAPPARLRELVRPLTRFGFLPAATKFTPSLTLLPGAVYIPALQPL